MINSIVQLEQIEKSYLDRYQNCIELLRSIQHMSEVGAVIPHSSVQTIHPSAAPTDSASRRTLALGDDFGVNVVEWFDYLGNVFTNHLISPLRKAGTPPPNAKLVVCVLMDPGINLRQYDRTIQSFQNLRLASEYPVVLAFVALGRIFIEGKPLDAIVKDLDCFIYDSLGSAVVQNNPADLFLCIHCGDIIRPELHMALKFFGCFDKELTLTDLYFIDDDMVYPLLLNGVDDVHVKYVDFFFSRVVLRGSCITTWIDKLPPEDEVNSVYALCANTIMNNKNECCHVPLPMIELDMRMLDIKMQQESLIYKQLSQKNIEVTSKASIATGEKVSAIICTRNGTTFLQQLIWRLLKEPEIGDIVIVSNNTDFFLAKLYLDSLHAQERITILRYDKPFNFSAQCNLAAQFAKSDLLLFVNDDICPISNDWLRYLITTTLVSGRNSTVVGPLLLYPNQKVQHAGMFFGFNGVAGHAVRNVSPWNQDKSFKLCAPRRVDCLTGAALLLSRHLFDEINGFDPLLATYLQDVDFSMRVVASGCNLIIDPRAILFHMESISLTPELANPQIRRTRELEYNYFRSRWQSRLGHNAWMHPLISTSDESFRTLHW